jgi:CheY-like chemotaxis protein
MSERDHVLVVDDSPANLLMLEEFLVDTPYRVTSFQEPRAALSAIGDGLVPDAILLDRMMPAMNGIEFLRALRAEAGFKRVPVIMQTAAALPHQIAEGLAEGVFYYLTKPFKREVLQAVLRNALAHRAAYRGLEESIRRADSAVTRLDSCRFTFRDIADVDAISAFLARAYPAPADALVGIRELMLNAVEHGNLAITYEAKSALIESGGWQAEIERRLAQQPYAGRAAQVALERRQDGIELTIRDQGAGFDWRRFLTFDSDRAHDSHGRGIAMSRALSFDAVDYAEPGNCVVAFKRLTR